MYVSVTFQDWHYDQLNGDACGTVRLSGNFQCIKVVIVKYSTVDKFEKVNHLWNLFTLTKITHVKSRNERKYFTSSSTCQSITYISFTGIETGWTFHKTTCLSHKDYLAGYRYKHVGSSEILQNRHTLPGSLSRSTPATPTLHNTVIANKCIMYWYAKQVNVQNNRNV